MVRSADPQQGPQNIYDIAQFRDHCLKNNLGMRTIIHDPHDGGHVHTQARNGDRPRGDQFTFPSLTTGSRSEPKKAVANDDAFRG